MKVLVHIKPKTRGSLNKFIPLKNVLTHNYTELPALCPSHPLRFYPLLIVVINHDGHVPTRGATLSLPNRECAATSRSPQSASLREREPIGFYLSILERQRGLP